ncbi:hypothetical protein M9H77_32058 [Catharanthus roseus]|uniref:Uncharacterized protein n=2 Tax=Catharanthus roseus TaxID=4058 RepID=A0ACC0A5Q2_CATRO|nr:hypothetical protein M9H77_32055 [Catharanthus roseus]KAI5654871.1 hypothetical protein M9H77_32058 [Catharanthus roseus]
MANKVVIIMQILVLELVLLSIGSSAGRVLLNGSVKEQDDTMLFKYHNGPLLSGKISINLIWYGNFKPSQRVIVSDFITSFSSSQQPQPSVATWWKNVEKYFNLIKSNKPKLSLGNQTFVENYPMGKSLTMKQIQEMAAKGSSTDESNNTINVVLTSSDVTVEGFCSSKCGTHGKTNEKFTFIWVGNAETQCPGQCAWPFHQPIYGPQTAPLVAPNNDVGLDGMVMNLGTLLAGTVTNPFGNGYYQGPASAPLEAASACPGIYGKGAYPGYAGNLLVDSTTGASYNAHGVNGRKYLLPALYDPSTSACSTLV